MIMDAIQEPRGWPIEKRLATVVAIIKKDRCDGWLVGQNVLIEPGQEPVRAVRNPAELLDIEPGDRLACHKIIFDVHAVPAARHAIATEGEPVTRLEQRLGTTRESERQDKQTRKKCPSNNSGGNWRRHAQRP